MLSARRRRLLAWAEAADPNARYFLVGSVHRDKESLTVAGYWHSVRIEGTRLELDLVEELLATFDGRTPLGEPRREVLAALTVFLDSGVLYDARQMWLLFNDLSANPSPFYGLSDPLDAYQRPYWVMRGDGRKRPVDPTWVEGGRTSALHRAAQVDPALSFRVALDVAHNGYSVRPEGDRPVPSAGAMYPLHLWVLGRADDASANMSVTYVSECGEEFSHRTVPMATVTSALGDDREVLEVVKAGAAAIVVTADPSQMVAKYGNRGWRYCLIEAGGVMLRAQEAALERDARLRPFGGFADEALAEILKAPLYPILVLLVTACIA